MEEPGRLQSTGSRRVGHNWETSLSLFTFMRWRRKWQPTPVFLPGESQGQGSLVGCRLWHAVYGVRVGHDRSDVAAAATVSTFSIVVGAFFFFWLKHWKRPWNANTLATWCEELTDWKRPWCWERSKARGEAGDRGWDGWMVSLTWWTWVWAISRSWWWTGKPGTLQSMGLQRVGHDCATELNI